MSSANTIVKNQNSTQKSIIQKQTQHRLTSRIQRVPHEAVFVERGLMVLRRVATVLLQKWTQQLASERDKLTICKTDPHTAATHTFT